MDKKSSKSQDCENRSDASLSTRALERVGKCNSSRDLLLLLKEHLESWGFGALRYYHYDLQQGRLVSVDSAGMPNDVSKALREGAIIRFEHSTPLESHDSFWCCHKKVPILFIVDEDKAKLPLLSESLFDNTLVIYLKSDNCRKLLESHKRPRWVDFPLIVAGKCIGKISSDIEPPYSDSIEALEPAVQGIARLVNLIAPILEFLHSEPLKVLSIIRENTANCTSLESLFDFCTGALASNYFNCEYASFFTFSEDIFASRKLILRRTSFPELKTKEGVAYYRMDENALTTWVANHGEAVRLHSFDDDTALREQLRAYGKGIEWKNKHPDSETNTTFLAVPLGSQNEPQGVLRYTQKRVGRFTEADQILLERVARDYITPRLQVLGQSASLAEVAGEIRDVHAISLSFTSRQAMPRELCQAMERSFPQGQGPRDRKLYLINLLEYGSKEFQHYAIGGDLESHTLAAHKYTLEGSFTARVLDAEPSTSVLVNNLDCAHHAGGFHLICPDAVCALGSPLVQGNRAYGALIVMSEKYDLLEVTKRDALSILAAEVSQLFGLKEILDFSSGLLGMKHDCGTLLNKVKEFSIDQPEGWQKRIAELVTFLLETVDTYCSPAGRDAPAFAEHKCIEINVRSEIEVAAAAAQLEMGEVCGLNCVIDENLVANIHPCYFMNITYNLLKNAWASTPVNGPQVVVDGKLANGYLEVMIRDYGHGMPLGKMEEYNSPDSLRMLTFGLPYKRVKGLGLLVARRIASWHRLPDGRTGEVILCQVKESRGLCAVIRLPIATQYQ